MKRENLKVERGITWEIKLVLANETCRERDRLPEVIAQYIRERMKKEECERYEPTPRRAGRAIVKLEGALGTFRI